MPAELADQLARLIEMRAAESVAGVQHEQVAVGDVERGECQRKTLAEILADGEIKGRVRGQMIGPVLQQETRSEIQVSRGPDSAWKLNVVAGAERVALVVIEEEKPRRRRLEVGEAAGDRAFSLRVLVRIRQVQAGAVRDFRGAKSGLPGANACASDCEREENV